MVETFLAGSPENLLGGSEGSKYCTFGKTSFSKGSHGEKETASCEGRHRVVVCTTLKLTHNLSFRGLIAKDLMMIDRLVRLTAFSRLSLNSVARPHDPPDYLSPPSWIG